MPRFCITMPVRAAPRLSRTPNRATDVGNDQARGVGSAHPDGVAHSSCAFQGAALRRSIAAASASRKRREIGRRMRQPRRIGEHPITHRNRALAASSVRAGDRSLQALTPSRREREDHERHETGRRRRRVHKVPAEIATESGAASRRGNARDRSV